jgi:hypothetical protein
MEGPSAHGVTATKFDELVKAIMPEENKVGRGRLPVRYRQDPKIPFLKIAPHSLRGCQNLFSICDPFTVYFWRSTVTR